MHLYQRALTTVKRGCKCSGPGVACQVRVGRELGCPSRLRGRPQTLASLICASSHSLLRTCGTDQPYSPLASDVCEPLAVEYGGPICGSRLSCPLLRVRLGLMASGPSERSITLRGSRLSSSIRNSSDLLLLQRATVVTSCGGAVILAIDMLLATVDRMMLCKL